MPDIRIWSRLSNTGGVSESARKLASGWVNRGHGQCSMINLDSPFGAARGLVLSSTPDNLFWASSITAALQHGLLARLCRGDRYLFVHAGSPEQIDDVLSRADIFRRRLCIFDDVYANNEALANCLISAGIPCSLASCFTPAREDTRHDATPGIRARRPLVATQRALVAQYGASDHHKRMYGVELAMDAVALARNRGLELDLTILRYGMDVHSTLRAGALEAWCSEVVELPSDGIRDLLSEHDMLLRPSTTDGDSMLVREAMEAGTRVIASDVVARPCGVEVVPLDAAAFTEAMISGGKVSTGEGLGRPIIDLLCEKE